MQEVRTFITKRSKNAQGEGGAIAGQIITTNPPSSHPKWWFSEGILPKCPKHSGLVIIILICPEQCAHCLGTS